MPQLIKDLRTEGYKIILITAYSGSRKARVQNLKEYNIEYDQLIFDGDKLPLVQEINPEWCVEDRPSTIKKYADAGFKVAVPAHWNYCQDSLAHKNVNGYRTTDELRKLLC